MASARHDLAETTEYANKLGGAAYAKSATRWAAAFVRKHAAALDKFTNAHPAWHSHPDRS